MNMIVGYELNNYRSFMESVLTLVKVIFGEADFGELMEVRSPRFEVLRCLHFVDVTRVCLTMPWVVSLLISRLRVGSGAWTVRMMARRV